MRIKKIKISRSEKSLKITNSKGNVYVLKPSRGEKISRFDLICVITEIMLEHKKKKSDKIRASFNEIVNKCDSWKDKAGTIYNQWLTYTNPEKYGNNAPFSISGQGINDGMTTAQNQKKFLPIAKSVFGKDGKGEEAYYWLGNYKTTEIEFCPSLEEKHIGATIFTQNDKEYVRFLFKTEDLNYDIMKSSKYFNITLPKKIEKTSPDLSNIPRDDNRELAKLLNENKSVLILAPIKTGKTRQAFEEIRNIKNAYVFSLKQEAFHQMDNIEVSNKFNEKNKKLIWFIDDIHYCGNVERNHDALWRMREKLTAKFENLIIVATLRTDKKHLIESSIFEDMEPLNMSTWAKEDEKKLAINYQKDPLKIKFTGNPFFSVIGEMEKLKQVYDGLPSNTKDVFRFLKLLKEFLQFVEYKLLEETYYCLVRNPAPANFEDCLNKLEHTGLIKKEDRFVLTWEPYLEEIVTTKDYPYLISDLERLINLFVKLKKPRELHPLVTYFFAIEEFEKAIESNKQMLAFVSCDKYFMIYYFWGTVLTKLAKQKKDEKLYYEAFEKFALAVKLKEDVPSVYFHWGCALVFLAEQKKDKNLYKEAYRKFMLAIKFKEDYARAYVNLGAVFLEIAKLEESKKQQKIMSREAFKVLFQSYLLSILQEDLSFIEVPAKKMLYIYNEIDNTICMVEMITVELGLKASLSDKIKISTMFSEEHLDFLQKTKGKFSDGDIIINAILENKKPDVAEIPDDDLLLRTAVFLANKIIDRKRNLKK